MIFGRCLFAGALIAASAGAFAQGAASMGAMTTKAGSMSSMSSNAMLPDKSGNVGKLKGPEPRLPSSTLPGFKQADTNGDGRIEWKEAKAQHVPRKFFKKEDYEHNGKLDKTEWMLVGFDTTEARQGKHKTSG